MVEEVNRKVEEIEKLRLAGKQTAQKLSRAEELIKLLRRDLDFDGRKDLKDSERRFETMVKEAENEKKRERDKLLEEEGTTIHTLEESISDIDDVDVKNLREGIRYEYVKEEVEKIFQMHSSAAVGSFAKGVLYDVVLDSGFGGERT
ncbi:OLC1v1024304C1 [Oldenlandia corymbosa var. corymbosa]|uniref:OLC1v1024304C1 n=1 Tax=Oldenlandia corymbosa var. corymbosa TaxID=529605 RepID=A0AAV1C4B2_OLDCO|nr:OLC1v1024304C1 [Oldenlandia corymbosa var. corymbosa]